MFPCWRVRKAVTLRLVRATLPPSCRALFALLHASGRILTTAFFRIPGQALLLGLREISLEISTTATGGKRKQFIVGPQGSLDGGCGCSDLPSCVTLPLQTPAMHCGQRFGGFKMCLSLCSTEYSGVPWGHENSHFLPPCHGVAATIKACCKLLLQSHEEK